VMPPRLAPIQVVIVPISRTDEERALVLAKAREIAEALPGVRTHIDARDNMTAGAKFYEWELKGVPFRMEVGPKDIAKQQVVLARRVIEEGAQRKEFLPEAEALASLPARLEEFQAFLLERARARREANSHRGVESYERLREIVEGVGGFVYAGWCGSAACEEQVKDETKATIRVIPDEEFLSPTAPTKCLLCGEGAQHEVVWARAY
jgi:prolyl-tRNA synthetase